MTKRSFKIRKRLLEEDSIHHFKDFGRFRKMYKERRRKETIPRLIIALVSLLLLCTVLFYIAARPKHPKDDFKEIKINAYRNWL